MPGRLKGLEGLKWQNALKSSRPVPVLNDAQAALMGEVWMGAARGATNVFLLTLGTGVGGAAMVDGRVLRGHLGRAGHLGHVSLDPNAPPAMTPALAGPYLLSIAVASPGDLAESVERLGNRAPAGGVAVRGDGQEAQRAEVVRHHQGPEARGEGEAAVVRIWPQGRGSGADQGQGEQNAGERGGG